MILNLGFDIVFKPILQLLLRMISPHKSFFEVAFAACKPESVVNISCESDKLLKAVDEVILTSFHWVDFRSCLHDLLELCKGLLVFDHKEHQVLRQRIDLAFNISRVGDDDLRALEHLKSFK